MSTPHTTISLRLEGGLGNQLFQLAAAVHIRDVVGIPVVLDRQFYFQHYANMDPRSLEIGVLPHGFTLIRGRGRSSWVRALPRAFVRRVITRGAPIILFNEAVAAARSTSDPSPEQLALIELADHDPPFFQSATPPMANAATMRTLLETRIPLAFRPETDSPYISVHSRLGDYVNERWSGDLGPTDPSSLLALGRELSERHGGLPIRVFTDSPGLFARICPPSDTNRYELSDAVSPWDALADMARAHALVMSNSTLSWWAAFIATSFREQPADVLMPHPWFVDHRHVDEILPMAGWTMYQRSLLDLSSIEVTWP